MISVCYGVVLLMLAVYSYTQIDLNLTLSSNLHYQQIQQQLIWVGYYDRPLSAWLFITLMAILSILFGWAIIRAYQQRLTQRTLVRIILLSVVLGVVSYPAFSHDLFNYMFDARIVTTYGANPYLHKALDFPDDLWVRFMHWTHRTYPYGPVWLLLTLPVSFIGMGKFVPTLFLFKLLFALFHLGNVWLIWQVAKTLKLKNPLLAIVLYALNPLVIVESLVSPHNEVMMVFFLLLGLYLCLKRSPWQGITAVILSAGVKFITVVTLPVLFFLAPVRKKWGDQVMILSLIAVLLLPLLEEIREREPYAWYLLPIMAVGSLSDSRWVRLSLAAASMGFLVRYASFLSFGDYQSATYLWENGASLIAVALVMSIGYLGLRVTNQNS